MYSKACDSVICRGQQLGLLLKITLAFLGSALACVFYLIRSPISSPDKKLAEMAIDPAVIEMIRPHYAFAITAMILTASIVLVIMDDYKHGFGAFLAAIGLPPAIFAILNAIS